MGLLPPYFLPAVLTCGATHAAFVRVIALWFENHRGLARELALPSVGLDGLYRQFFKDRHRIVRMARKLFINFRCNSCDCDARDVLWLIDKPQAATVPTAAVSAATAELFFWLMLTIFFLIGIAVQSMTFLIVPLLTLRSF